MNFTKGYGMCLYKSRCEYFAFFSLLNISSEGISKNVDFDKHLAERLYPKLFFNFKLFTQMLNYKLKIILKNGKSIAIPLAFYSIYFRDTFCWYFFRWGILCSFHISLGAITRNVSFWKNLLARQSYALRIFLLFHNKGWCWIFFISKSWILLKLFLFSLLLKKFHHPTLSVHNGNLVFSLSFSTKFHIQFSPVTYPT